MKLHIDQDTLSRALTICSKSLLSKTSLPVLANLLLEATDGNLTITSTDLETAVEVSIKTKIDTKGKITVVGRTFGEFVSQLSDEKIVLEKLGEELVITSKNYNARLATMPAEEFPAIPKIEKGKKFTISAKELVRVCTKVVFCAAQDEGRPVLTGCLWETKGGKISTIATDGYRLSYSELKTLGGEAADGLKLVIPAKALSGLVKIIEEMGDSETQVNVEIAQNLNQINFKFENIEYTSRLIEGDFPDWEKIIPSDFNTKAIFSREDFARLVRSASIFARESGNVIRVKLIPPIGKGRGQVMVTAQANQVGSGQAQTDAQISGAGGEIAFNYRYLLEVLGAIGDDEVQFEMIESLNPSRVTGKSAEDGFFHIIMPVRLQG